MTAGLLRGACAERSESAPRNDILLAMTAVLFYLEATDKPGVKTYVVT